MARQLHTISHADSFNAGGPNILNKGYRDYSDPAVQSNAPRGVPCVLMAVQTAGNFGPIDVDAIALAQQPGAGGVQDLVLAGAFVVDGVAIFPIMGRGISITSDANDATIDFTFYGTDINGDPHVEVLAGANVSTVNGFKGFATVTRVTVSGDTTGNVSCGDGDVYEMRTRGIFTGPDGTTDDSAIMIPFVDGVVDSAPTITFPTPASAPTASDEPARLTYTVDDFSSEIQVLYVPDLSANGKGVNFTADML